MSIELRSVSYRYPGFGRPAIEAIDLAVADGEVVGLVGPNEAGKSTICLVAAGLAPGSIGGELTGEVRIDDEVIAGRPPHALAGRVGIVLSNPAVQRSGIADTVFEEVALGPVNLGLPVEATVERTREALRALAIDDLALRSPERLSGGQAQLVAVASMLAMRPRQLVLDEPTSELDSDGRHLVIDALVALVREGTALFVAEHDREVLAAVGARLVEIRGGRLA